MSTYTSSTYTSDSSSQKTPDSDASNNSSSLQNFYNLSSMKENIYYSSTNCYQSRPELYISSSEDEDDEDYDEETSVHSSLSRIYYTNKLNCSSSTSASRKKKSARKPLLEITSPTNSSSNDKRRSWGGLIKSKFRSKSVTCAGSTETNYNNRGNNNHFSKQYHEKNYLNEELDCKSQIDSIISMTSIDSLSLLAAAKKKSYSRTLLELIQNEGYCHACNAGKLWQSIVGQFVRFPKEWKFENTFSTNKWKFISRSLIRASIFLQEFVPQADSPGRILLHVRIKDLETLNISQEIVIGCFHPKLVYEDNTNFDIDDDTRVVWMAINEFMFDGAVSEVRKLRKDATLIEPFLGKTYEEGGVLSPLGNDKSQIGNWNLRTLFGELPPIKTLIMKESTLYEQLLNYYKNDQTIGHTSPAILLLNTLMFE